MHNPTKGSGLADCFVIIYDKFAKNECLAVVILYIFLRGAQRLGMGNWGTPSVGSNEEAPGGFWSPLILV